MKKAMRLNGQMHFSQSLLPHEIIVVDAGSTDRTLELLKERTRDSQIHVELITEQKINIAAGRNLAIEKASHEVIVVSDFGCRPHKDWLENISESSGLTRIQSGLRLVHCRG